MEIRLHQMCHWYQRGRNGNIKNMRYLKSSAGTPGNNRDRKGACPL